MDAQGVSFRVAKDDFGDAVSWVARNLPTKAAQPVLRAMVISATDEGLEIAGFDYEVSTRARISAEVMVPGRIAVAGKLLSDIIGLQPNKPIDVSVDGSQAIVTCGSGRYELPLIPLEEYPKIPQLPETTGQIDPALFSQIVGQVAAAAGKDETLPMLTGVHVQVEVSTLTLAATDRFRLAQRRVEWQPKQPDITAELLIPAKTLQDNARTLDTNNGEPIDIAVGSGDQIGADGLFGVHAGNRETTTRMLDAEFPNISPLLPKAHSSMASIEIGPLSEAIRRVALVADRNAQIRMQFSEGQVILSAGGTDAGHAEEVVPCAFAGRDDLLIAFNPSYLRDGLAVIDTDRVVFGFTEPARPAIMIPQPENMPELGEDGMYPTPATNFTYLLMPVRLPG